MRRICFFSLAIFATTFGAVSQAAVKTKEVRYSHGGTEFVGYLAFDDATEGRRPGVLVLHEWWGLNDYAKKRTEMLAKMGYVAFAADMYGKGQVTEHPQEAGAMAGKVRQNVAEWRGRAEAALGTLKQQENVDPEQLAAIGYCFGGATALQLAYGGADLDAVVTFHAALPMASTSEAAAIKPQLLINHGAADPFVPQEAVAAFKQALSNSDAEWTFVEYSQAKHGFTVRGAEEKGLEGLAYDQRADQQSWRLMSGLFTEVFSDRPW